MINDTVGTKKFEVDLGRQGGVDNKYSNRGRNVRGKKASVDKQKYQSPLSWLYRI